MITLHKFVPAWGLPDISPFCVKVETYLRMTGAEYRTVVSDSRKAPKGKCPYIEHDGRVISDSSMIIEYLESRSSSPMDSDLTAQERAISTALKAAAVSVVKNGLPVPPARIQTVPFFNASVTLSLL